MEFERHDQSSHRSDDTTADTGLAVVGIKQEYTDSDCPFSVLRSSTSQQNEHEALKVEARQSEEAEYEAALTVGETNVFSTRSVTMHDAEYKPVLSDIRDVCYSVPLPQQGGLVAHDTNALVCLECGKTFSQAERLKLHARCHAKLHACRFCAKAFRDKHALERHENIHTGNKPFACKFCGKRFIQSANVKYHELTHSERKPYACRFCDKSFGRASNLKSHEYVHTGERPFCCSMCAATFTSAAGVTQHEATHAPLKRFSCPHCPKTFSVRFNMTAHIAVHTGDKKYACALCGKAFSRGAHLQRHERTHSGERPYKCSAAGCHKAFADSSGLTKHERKQPSHKTIKAQCLGPALVVSSLGTSPLLPTLSLGKLIIPSAAATVSSAYPSLSLPRSERTSAKYVQIAPKPASC